MALMTRKKVKYVAKS